MSKLRAQRFTPLITALVMGAAVVGCSIGGCNNDSNSATAPVTTSAAKVQHVFMIVLENKNYSDTFGKSTQDPYLQKRWCRRERC